MICDERFFFRVRGSRLCMPDTHLSKRRSQNKKQKKTNKHYNALVSAAFYFDEGTTHQFIMILELGTTQKVLRTLCSFMLKNTQKQTRHRKKKDMWPSSKEKLLLLPSTKQNKKQHCKNPKTTNISSSSNCLQVTFPSLPSKRCSSCFFFLHLFLSFPHSSFLSLTLYLTLLFGSAFFAHYSSYDCGKRKKKKYIIQTRIRQLGTVMWCDVMWCDVIDETALLSLSPSHLLQRTAP